MSRRLAVAAAALIAQALPARADDLDRVKQLEAQLEYDQALAVVEQLLARGGATPSACGELHWLAGRLAAGLDRSELAERHFAIALALVPTATLPAGTSPKIIAPYAAAKSRSRPLTATARRTRRAIRLIVDDPLGIAVSAAVVVADDRRTEVVARGSLEVALADGITPLEVAALDASGNRLWVGRAPELTVHKVAPPAIYKRWYLWGGIGAAALASGGFAAWRTQAAQSEWDRLRAEGGHDFSTLERIEQRGRRWAAVANTSFAAAGAFGIATVLCLVLVKPPPSDSDLVELVVQPSGVAVRGRF